MLYIFFFFLIGRASLGPSKIKNKKYKIPLASGLGLRPPEYTEITQISDLRFIFSEYEDHPKMMRGSGSPRHS